MSEVAAWLQVAANEARKSLCLRSSCGAALVKDGRILGTGYNAPPQDDLSHRACLTTWPSARKPKSDRTCCVHAEWRTLLRALKVHPRAVEGSTMVFVRVDTAGLPRTSGKPYCTVCSRLAFDAGVGFWILRHAEGIRQYTAAEYHQLSERYDLLTSGAGSGILGGEASLADDPGAGP